MSDLLRISPNSNFYIQELVSPWWIGQAKNPAHVLRGLRSTNPAMIEGLNLIRSHVAVPVKVNDWHSGGGYSESGLRTPSPVSEQQFTIFSTHMFWGSCDLKFKGVGIEVVFDLILRNPRTFHMVLAMEDISATRSSRGIKGNDWLHVQFGYRPLGRAIRIFKP